MSLIRQRLSRSVQQVDPVDVEVPWMNERREPKARVVGIGAQSEAPRSSVINTHRSPSSKIPLPTIVIVASSLRTWC